MKPGTSKLIRVRFLPAGLAAGAYYVTGAVDTAGAFAESNETNNTACERDHVRGGREHV